jgi:hypothetical protein
MAAVAAQEEAPRAARLRERSKPAHGICMWYLRGLECYGDGKCTGSHLDKADRPVCAIWLQQGYCKHGDDCRFPHRLEARFRDVNAALQAAASHAERTRDYVCDVLGRDTVLFAEVVRAHEVNKLGDAMVLLKLRPEAVAGSLLQLKDDPNLSNAVRRGYVLEASFRELRDAVSYALGRLAGYARPVADAGGRPRTVVRLMVHPGGLLEKLADGLDAAHAVGRPLAGADTDCTPSRVPFDYDLLVSPRSADALLSVVSVDGVYYVGLAAADDPAVNFGVMGDKRQAVFNFGVSRAFFKLSELNHRLAGLLGPELPSPIPLSSVGAEGAGGGSDGARRGLTAIDVGASPGGWTQYLLSHLGYRRVIAVDPGAMAPSLVACSGMEHLPMRLEAAVARLLERGDAGSLDAYFCDANVPTPGSVELFRAALPLLKPGAVVVITLKNFDGSRATNLANRAAAKAEVERLCCGSGAAVEPAEGGAATVGDDSTDSADAARIIHLMNNGQQEVTLVARYRGPR